jgi:hypothetical protein
VDPHPHDQLIAWMEDTNETIEEHLATQRQMNIDEELRRSAEWALAAVGAEPPSSGTTIANKLDCKFTAYSSLSFCSQFPGSSVWWHATWKGIRRVWQTKV